MLHILLGGAVLQNRMAAFCIWCESVGSKDSIRSPPFPFVQVSDRDDKLLTEQLLDLERANQEVAGDDDSEEEEVGMGELEVEAA